MRYLGPRSLLRAMNDCVKLAYYFAGGPKSHAKSWIAPLEPVGPDGFRRLYSSKDKPAADAACAVFEAAGIHCWIAPRDVMPGGEYGAAIVDAIERCRVMVLIFSSNANESAQIRREIERAVKKGVTIIPVRIEEVEPTQSMEYFLGAIHWLDALTPPLEKHLQHLAETIKAMLQAKAVQRGKGGDQTATKDSPSPAIGTSASFARADESAPKARPASKPDARRRWIWPAAIGLSALAVVGAAVWLYGFVSQPKHKLGPPIDGWTDSAFLSLAVCRGLPQRLRTGRRDLFRLYLGETGWLQGRRRSHVLFGPVV